MSKMNELDVFNARGARGVVTADHRARCAIDALILKARNSAIDVQADVQKAVMAAMAFYAISPECETVFITRIYNIVSASKGLNASKLKEYVMALSPGLVFRRNRAGDYIFVHDRRKPVPTLEYLAEAMSAKAWHEHKRLTANNGGGGYQGVNARSDFEKFAKSTMRKLGPAHAMTRAEWISAAAAAYDKALRDAK